MAAKEDLANTPRKSIVSRLCRCCNKFIPASNHPLNLFGSKAKKEKLEELILEYGRISIEKGDGCSEKMCKVCFSNIKHIEKLIGNFRKTCMESSEHQMKARDRSKRCRRTTLNQDSPKQAAIKKHRRSFRPILPAPEEQPQAIADASSSTTRAAAKSKRVLPFLKTSKPDDGDEPTKSDQILKTSGLKNPNVCIK